MSELETHIGKLKRVDLSNYDNNTEKFFEEQFRKTFTELTEQEIQENYQTELYCKCHEDRGPWECLFQDNYYDNFMEDKYYVANGIIYEVIEEEAFNPDDDISILKDNGDGTYDYFTMFYNGGTYLRECIENELEKKLFNFCNIS